MIKKAVTEKKCLIYWKSRGRKSEKAYPRSYRRLSRLLELDACRTWKICISRSICTLKHFQEWSRKTSMGRKNKCIMKTCNYTFIKIKNSAEREKSQIALNENNVYFVERASINTKIVCIQLSDHITAWNYEGESSTPKQRSNIFCKIYHNIATFKSTESEGRIKLHWRVDEQCLTMHWQNFYSRNGTSSAQCLADPVSGSRTKPITKISQNCTDQKIGLN